MCVCVCVCVRIVVDQRMGYMGVFVCVFFLCDFVCVCRVCVFVSRLTYRVEDRAPGPGLGRGERSLVAHCL